MNFRIRVRHLQCDMSAWTKKCSPASVGLKNEYECRLLPKTCQKDVTLQQILAKDACSMDSFSRKLRQRSSAQLTTVSSVLSTVLLVIFSILVL